MQIPVFARSPAFDPERFRVPHAIDRGAPFWSWNGALDATRLERQWNVFREMGLGGATLHPRTGLATPYLGPEFLQHVGDCVERAKHDGQLVWLYDEDRWPSGFAGGLAVRNPAHWVRHLRITRQRLAPGANAPCPVHHGAPKPNTERTFMAAWALRFEKGLLAEHSQVDESHPEANLFAYLEVPPGHSWFNNAQYIDTLNPEAMAQFIRVTHETYREHFGEAFGKQIPSIFADEPLFRGMDRPLSPDDTRDCIIAWTGTLSDTYQQRFQESLWSVLPDMLFDRADGGHFGARWRFHEHHTERFVEAFAAQIGAWCGRHGIALTGHLMAEGTLQSQTVWCGDVMRSLRHFQLPGIDMLCDQQELTTAKQAQSIARQTGAPGVMSELYGVTNWDFPFAGHKRQGDWQAALGVTTRVHHLTWYQMGGEAKRDYPASMGEHSPWWREYPVVEDHFARLNAALGSGRPHCRVGMLHPVESMWLLHGPAASATAREALEQSFAEPLRWMLEALIDVDLINEATLPDLSPMLSDAPLFPVGAMNYEVVVVPRMLTLRRSTLERLEAFTAAGGQVLLLGDAPGLLEGEADETLPTRTAAWTPVPYSAAALLSALAPWRDLEWLDAGNRTPVRGVLHQMRDLPDGGRILFLCQPASGQQEKGILRLRGEWNPLRLNTADGSNESCGASLHGGYTEIPLHLPEAGHVLLHLRPGTPERGPVPPPAWQEFHRLGPPWAVTMNEENVLVMDRAEWCLDQGGWQSAADVLRLDNLARAALGQEPRSGDIAQPWVQPPLPDTHTLSLRFELNVDQPTGPLRLALEDAARARIELNGESIDAAEAGEWVDVALQTRALPSLPPGQHHLVVHWPFGGAAQIENVYLLGTFGVELRGSLCRLTAAPETPVWGDLTRMGLPFYGGNLTYRVRCELPETGPLSLSIPHAAAATVKVRVGGLDLGQVFRAPWRIEIPEELRGLQDLELTAFGTRFNTFGQLHNCNARHDWWGPASWRTTGEHWSDEYQVRKSGILVAPILMRT